jgi:hypothetical protein
VSIVWSKGSTWSLHPYVYENELEDSIDEIVSELFGPNRVYLRVKKKVGRNVPDGYLIDLASKKPRLFFVEVETSLHDPYRHIAPQILQFSMSFKKDPWRLKGVLHDALKDNQKGWDACVEFVAKNNFNSVDHLLELLVQDTFSALVIIDEIDPDLEVMLSEGMSFPVEVVTVQRYKNVSGEFAYVMDPFLRDVRVDIAPPSIAASAQQLSVSDIDTVVVPAHEAGFQETFLGEDEWRSIRMHGSMRPQIKYIAAYRVKPVSAITHIAKVREIVPSSDAAGKWRLIFDEHASEIGPIALVPHGRVKQLQSIRYTTRDRLLNAKTLDEVWASDD